MSTINSPQTACMLSVARMVLTEPHPSALHQLPVARCAPPHLRWTCVHVAGRAGAQQECMWVATSGRSHEAWDPHANRGG
jgi:hypothetical protein